MTARDAVLQYQQCFAFDGNACKNAGYPGAGINIYAITADVGMIHRCMAMHDVFFMDVCRIQEFAADPEQIIEFLRFNWYPWLNTRVNKQIIAAAKAVSKTLKKQFVSAGKGL